MLLELTIENIAVISKATIHFQQGFNVFTGETGAGKSILLGAIGAVLGERTSKEIIRTGESRARVTALFAGLHADVLRALKDAGVECEEGEELLLSRDITAEHNLCRINGRPVTVAMLRSLGQALINTHGQQDNQMLMNADNHRRFVDSFGELAPLLTQYQQTYEALCELRKEMDRLTMDEQEKNRRIDLLTHRVEEIAAAGLTIGEDDELIARRKLIKNSKELCQSLSSCRELLHGSEDTQGAVSLLEDASHALKESAMLLEDLEDAARRLNEYRYEIDDIAETVRDQLGLLEFDPNELEQIEERLNDISFLKRKYAPTIEAILKVWETEEVELDSLTRSEQMIAQLATRLEQTETTAKDYAARLTKARTKSAERFSNAVAGELKSLDMPSVVLDVSVTPSVLSKTGADNVEFMLSVNPGEVPRPLSKIASGGEMSRIMLAIKSVVASADDIGSLIFDEIDTGVSGRAAQKVGQKLAKVSNGRQVICVTHLAQVAAFADYHLLIEKKIHDGRTFTQIIPLDDEGRANELARITAGEPITDLALETARELLTLSRKKREEEDAQTTQESKAVEAQEPTK